MQATFLATFCEPHESPFSPAIEATHAAAIQAAIAASIAATDEAAYRGADSFSIYPPDGAAVPAAARQPIQTAIFAAELAAE